MTTPHEPTLNPYIVFEADYWGEHLPVVESGMGGSIPKRWAADVLDPVVQPIVKGEMIGSKVAPKVAVDPLNPDLGAAMHHFCGTVLLADIEILRPVSPRLSYLDEIDIEDSIATMQPRDFLRRYATSNVYGLGSLMVPELVSYTNGEYSYSRYVNVVLIGRSRAGRPATGSLRSYTKPFNGDEPSRTQVVNDGILLNAKSVAESYERTDSNGEPVAIKRIRSLEICAVGAREVVKQPRFTFGAAHRTA